MVAPVHKDDRYEGHQQAKSRPGSGGILQQTNIPPARINNSESSVSGIASSSHVPLQGDDQSSPSRRGGGIGKCSTVSTPCARDDTISSMRDSPSDVDKLTPCIHRTLSEQSSASETQKDCFFLPFGGKHESKTEEQDLVKVLAEKTTTWMEEMEEKRRKETAQYRISQAIIGLRAASERSEEALEETSTLQGLVGDVGVAMFSPLDKTAFTPRQGSVEKEIQTDIEDEDTVTEEEFEVDYYPVIIEPESKADLNSCPRLLTQTMMQQLADEALPEIIRTMRWKRIFAIGRDGDAFCTMTQHCSSFKHTLVVAQTSLGDIFGGFATEPWTRQEGHNMGRCFFGSGQSFLFSNHHEVKNPDPPQASQPEGDDSSDCFHDSNMNELAVFKWTGSNRYCQVCDVDNGLIAMGGGGAFGLTVEENFSRGGSGKCDTFGNPPLIQSFDERFDISNFEVYGFVSASQALLS